MSGWTLRAALVISDANRILLIEGDEGWQLPTMTVASFMIYLDQAHRDIQDKYGADMTLLRIIDQSRNEDEKIHHAWWLMENHTQNWAIPDNSRWFDVEAIVAVLLTDEKDRPVLLDLFASFDQAEPALRPMFMKRGWFSGMRDWVSSSLKEHGYTLVRAPEQFKQFILTAILRTETDDGIFYAKVANPHYPLFCDEAHTTQALASLFPANIPMALSIHDDGMAIYGDFGTALWERDTTEADYIKIVETYAQLQIETASRIADLEQAGCINRRLDVLKASIGDLMVSEDANALLDDALHEQWLSCGETLMKLCDQLADYQLPYSLVHGDFHGGNVAMDGEKITFFDWTDACIAHPFFDVTTMIEFKGEDGKFLGDVYLKCWLDYESLERLQEAYELAYILSAVHQLVSYHSIRQYSEESYRSNFDWSIPRFVGVIVERLATLEK